MIGSLYFPPSPEHYTNLHDYNRSLDVWRYALDHLFVRVATFLFFLTLVPLTLTVFAWFQFPGDIVPFWIGLGVCAMFVGAGYAVLALDYLTWHLLKQASEVDREPIFSFLDDEEES